MILYTILQFHKTDNPATRFKENETKIHGNHNKTVIYSVYT